ncbi:hypothetical protein TNCV_644651 [Trichonephila clavipes]|nr:hypothetical protein TNCV_644651 [Trichonephila clavipes]
MGAAVFYECIGSSPLLQSRHLETMARRKGLSPDEITNLLRVISENESGVGELSCCNLDSDEDIKLSEIVCKESEEISNAIHTITVNPDMYDIVLRMAQN